MNNTLPIPCPFCGAETEIGVDTSISNQEFTVDCENCCRPIAVTINCEDGEIISSNVQPG